MVSNLPGFSRVHAVVFGITFLCVLLGSFADAWMSRWEPLLVLGLMLLLGLPHGATDRGLFFSLRNRVSRLRSVNFYAGYLGIIGLYALLWYLLPIVAFAVFIALSVYHFGQSNWVNVRYRSAFAARGHYLLWGAGALLTPILLHSEQALAISGSMLRLPLGISVQPIASWAAIALAVLNVGFIVYLFGRGVINGSRAGRELFAYGLLVALFLTNSLLLGFTIYFVVWHSLASALDQWRFFRLQTDRDRLFRPLLTDIVAVVTGAAVFCGFAWWYPAHGPALTPPLMGYVFIAISLLTLPHMVLVELLYKYWRPAAASAPSGEESFNSRGRKRSSARAVSIH